MVVGKQRPSRYTATMAKPHRYPAVPCPKCNRTLRPSGELTIEDQSWAIYQCDECLVRKDFGGEAFDFCLTFGVDRFGAIIDPESGEPLPPGWFA